MRMRRLLPAFVAILMLAMAVVLPGQEGHASEDERGTLFLNLTTDDPWTADMALTYAGKVRSMGYPVVVFLNVKGVRLANKAGTQEPGQDGVPPRDKLIKLINDGATVHVCQMCTKAAGMSQTDWIEGTKPGNEETIRIQMGEHTKVISY
ncbi:MAG: DsrE family protein [Rhodospirillales bacterium]|nr:DsrE family protein [Rhodospirillales bacterium]